MPPCIPTGASIASWAPRAPSLRTAALARLRRQSSTTSRSQAERVTSRPSPNPPKPTAALRPTHVEDASTWTNADANVQRSVPQLREELKGKHSSQEPSSHFSLSTILSSYRRQFVAVKGNVRSDDDVSDPASLIHPSAQTYLASKGYSPADVHAWYLVTTSPDAADAMSILSPQAAPSVSISSKTRSFPNFVFLAFLQRRRLDADTVRKALTILSLMTDYQSQSCKSVSVGQPISKDTSTRADQNQSEQDRAMFIMITRLVRHVRQSLPEAFPWIVQIFVNLLERRMVDRGEVPRRARTASRNADLCNKMLHLLSLPSPLNPYHTSAIQGRAQFDLLQWMAENNPPIEISRQGYQAIANIQLANKKTEQERDWGQLKAKTWPPWKQDRLGFDAEKGPDYGVSRALQAIRHANQAGYGSGMWEKVASVFAGWDTDGSPTIQTRAFMPRLGSTDIHLQPKDMQRHSALWEARVRTTRTVQEAWACFLAYEEQKLPAYQSVYLAMLEKVQKENDRQQMKTSLTSPNDDDLRPIVGGDSKEVFPVPESPMEGTYVRTDPPSFDTLVEKMYANGIKPRGRCLAFLLSSAKTFDEGLKYLSWGQEADATIAALTTDEPDTDRRVDKVPLRVFSAFISFLCRIRFAEMRHTTLPKFGTEPAPEQDRACSFSRGHLIVFAYRLMKGRRPNYRPPWHDLMRAVAGPSSMLGSTKDELPGPDSDTCRILIQRWLHVQTVRRDMRAAGCQVDVETFRILCQSLEHALLAAMAIQNEARPRVKEPWSTTAQADANVVMLADKVTGSCASYIRTLFYDLFGTQDARSLAEVVLKNRGLVPALTSSPHGLALHAYVRVLGFIRHWHGILEFTRWMVAHKESIDAAASMPRNGKRMLRQTIIAIRVFCEHSWIPNDTMKADNTTNPTSDGTTSPGTLTNGSKRASSIPPMTLHKIKDLIDHVDEWGGWASDAEVEEYCFGARAGRFPQNIDV